MLVIEFFFLFELFIVMLVLIKLGIITYLLLLEALI
jgi:hypothetical protein